MAAPWGAKAVQGEHGGYLDNGIDYYFFGNYFDENGWRDFSPSQVSQFFGKVGWQSGTEPTSIFRSPACTAISSATA